MDLNQNGKLLRDLRITKGMTQKHLAEQLGVVPKTVSKWETGHGFPDVSALTALADALGVSERMILLGHFIQNDKEIGNMKKTKFYLCPECGSIMQGTGENRIICCGKQMNPLYAAQPDDEHNITVSELENDFYVEIGHDMTKEHYVCFVAYAAYDRVLTVRLYPEQACSVRFSKMHGGKLYVCCNKHGLFEYNERSRKHE